MLQYAGFLILSTALVYSIIMKSRDWEKDKVLIREKYIPMQNDEYNQLSPMAKKIVDMLSDLYIFRKGKNTVGEIRYTNYNDVMAALKYMKNRGVDIVIDELHNNCKNGNNSVEFTVRS